MASREQPYHEFKDEVLENKTGSELVRKENNELQRLQLEIESEETSILAFSEQQREYLYAERVYWRLTATSEGTIELSYARQSLLVVLNLNLPESETSDASSLSCVQCCTGSCDPCNKCQVRHVLESPILRRIKDVGVEVINAYLFPLFSEYGKEVLSLIQLLTAITMLAVALPTFVAESREGHIPPTDIVRLSISLVSMILAGIDAAFAWRKCALCKTLVKCCSKVANQPQRFSQVKPVPLQQKVSIVEKYIKYFNDIIKLLITEALLYPTLICNVLDNASKRTYEGTTSEKFAFARFILSAFSLIVHVYLIRLIVIGATIIYLERIRRGKGIVTNCHSETTEPSFEEETIEDPHGKLRAFRGIILEIFFLVHVFGQMLTQGLMIGAIWSKVECENPEHANTMYLSPFTWVMVVLGFLLPIAGTCTFFIPTYFWAQEFPGDFIIGMLTSLKKRGTFGIIEGAHETVQKLDSILKKIGNSGRIYEKTNFFRKLFYPVYSPRLIFFSCIYDIILLSFAVFYFVGQIGISDSKPYIVCPFNLNISGIVARNITQQEVFSQLGSQISHFGLDTITSGWLLFCLVGVILVNVANIIVVLIGLFWMVIVPLFWPVYVPIILTIAFIYQAILKPVYKNCIKPFLTT